MKAASVHGGGDVLASISRKFGRRGQCGPCAPTDGIATDNGREGAKSSADMASSSSSALYISSPNAEGGLRDDAVLADEVEEWVKSEEARFRTTITLRKKPLLLVSV